MPLVTFALSHWQLSAGQLEGPLAWTVIVNRPKAAAVVIVVISRDTAISLRHSRVDVTRRAATVTRLPDQARSESQVHYAAEI